MECGLIVLTVVITGGINAVDQTKIEWNAVTPMVFGTDVRLVCNISCCSRNQGTAQASWDILRDKISINVAANSHSRDISKYEVLVGENRCSLVIKNFSQTDVNISYTCTSNFKSYTKVLEINEDEFELQPMEDITTLAHDELDGSTYRLCVNFTKVYPKPKCFVQYNGKDLTYDIQHQTFKSGMFYSSYQTIAINNVKDGNIRMTCMIGKSKYVVKEKEFMFKDNSTMSKKVKMMAMVIVLLSFIVILCVITHIMNITWIHTRGFCAISLIYIIDVYLSPFVSVQPERGKQTENKIPLLAENTHTSGTF